MRLTFSRIGLKLFRIFLL